MIRRPQLDARIAEIEARIPSMKPRTEQFIRLTRELRELRIERMKRDTHFRSRRRAA
jgi:hypothetical protein